MGYGSAFKAFVGLVVALSFVITGCPQNNGVAPAGTGSDAVGASGLSGFLPGGSDQPGDNGTAAFITVHKVVRANRSPDSQIELITLNGEIGTHCEKAEDCSCVFKFITGGNPVERDSQSLDYVETNLARCSFTLVDADAKYFDVYLRIPGNLTSNTTRVYMPTMSPGLDPSLATNFRPVQRFMCRDMITNMNTALYTGIIDPALWDLTMGFNFYTSSLGQDYGAIAQASGTGGASSGRQWECPPVPNDPSDNIAYDYTIYSLGDVDLNNPNNVNIPDGSGDNTIYPSDDSLRITSANCPTGNEPACEKFLANRHDFYVATFKSAVFKQPVCIIHKVANRVDNKIICDGIDTLTGTVTLDDPRLAGKDVIGFAAMPDTNQRCPDPNVVKVPPGKKWAKLWRFRGTFDKRSVPTVANQADIGTLYCTTREDSCVPGSNETTSTNGAPAGTKVVNSVCYNTKAPTGRGIPPIQSAVLAGNTSQGFGNCDMDGVAGDRNGPGRFTATPKTDRYLDAAAASAGNYWLNGCQNGDYLLWNLSTPVLPVYPPAPACIIPAPGSDSTECMANLPCTAKDPVTGTIKNYCCLDRGESDPANSYYRPANWTPGGSWCNTALIGRNDASSQALDITSALVDGAYTCPGNIDLPNDTVHLGKHDAGGYDDPETGTKIQGLAQDIWLYGNGGRHACIEADTDAGGKLADIFSSFPPSDANPYITTPLFVDTDSQSDIIYVVTPESVTFEQMQDIEHNPIARKYTPYRILTNSDAQSRVVYTLESSSQNTPNPIERLSQYPICVLQDAKKGLREGVAP